jgi:hypothetical protein
MFRKYLSSDIETIVVFNNKNNPIEYYIGSEIHKG